jgi:hypothetical protein
LRRKCPKPDAASLGHAVPQCMRCKEAVISP